MLQRIDPLKGTGIVASTNGKTQVEYELEVWQDQISTPLMDQPTALTPGKQEIWRGWIRPVCCPLNEIASLEMAGGKSVEFAFTDSLGTVRVYRSSNG